MATEISRNERYSAIREILDDIPADMTPGQQFDWYMKMLNQFEPDDVVTMLELKYGGPEALSDLGRLQRPAEQLGLDMYRSVLFENNTIPDGKHIGDRLFIQQETDSICLVGAVNDAIAEMPFIRIPGEMYAGLNGSPL